MELWVTVLENLKMAVEQSSALVQEHADLSQIVKIDEAKVSGHLNDLVRKTVQETLNEMLDAEAQALCDAQRYKRTETRKDCRAGFYQRKLQTQPPALGRPECRPRSQGNPTSSRVPRLPEAIVMYKPPL